MGPGLASSSSAALLIVCGAVNALLSKIVYQLEAPDCGGTIRRFEKPWLQTALMFLAMALCLPIAWAAEAWQRTQQQRTKGSAGDGDGRQTDDAEQPAPAAGSGSCSRPAGGGVQAEETAPDDAEAAAAALHKAAALGALLSAAGAAASAPPAVSDLAPSEGGCPVGTSLGGGTGEARGDARGDAGDLRQPLLPGRHVTSLELQQQQQQRERGPLAQPDAGGGHAGRGGAGVRGMSRRREALLLCVPTGFDLTATTLMNVGLLYVAASVFQILRGAEMVFAALFAVTLLRRLLNRWHYLGVALCMAGIACVGASRLLAGSSGSSGDGNTAGAARGHAALPGAAGPDLGDAAAAASRVHQGAADPKQALLGMCLILLSQALQAGQVTLEDWLMSDMDLQPLKVVGYEGLLGSLVMLGGALPLLQALPYADGSGLAEDTRGSWCMVRSSPPIAGALGVSTLAVLLYNVFGMLVTDSVGAAARTVLENARTLLVWLAALALYYTHLGGGRVGEAWDAWSWLQALGFAVFAAGALLYSKGHRQQEAAEAAAGRAAPYSKWAVLKSTLSIQGGHLVGARRFRAAGMAALAGVRARNLVAAAAAPEGGAQLRERPGCSSAGGGGAGDGEV